MKDKTSKNIENEEFKKKIDKAKVIVVDNAFEFDINKWKKERQIKASKSTDKISKSRDKNRIPVILDEIKKIWEKQPDTRLCQLIINATSIDPYYVEDEDLVRRLKNLYNDKSILYSGVFWIINHESNYVDCVNDPYLFKIKTTAEGEIDTNDLTYCLNAKSGKTYNHQKLWDVLPEKLKCGKQFDYYPRGRVMITNKKATIYYNPILNNESFKKYIIERFNLTKENGIKEIRFICDCSDHYKCHLDK